RLQASGRCRLMLGQRVTAIRHADGMIQALELGEQRLGVERLASELAWHLASVPGLHLAMERQGLPSRPELQAPQVRLGQLGLQEPELPQLA
ncbi:MAG: hypothetical protein RSA54_06195, partial [Glutamicibacter sp.]